MEYIETPEQSKNTKTEYLNSIDKFIEEREKKLTSERDIYIKDVFLTTEKYRADLCEMLGYPLTEPDRAKLQEVISCELADEGDYTISRLTFTLVHGIKLTGLLFKYKCGNRPMVIVQHGGLGTPEIISGIDGSDTYNYNHMLERVLNRGVNVFAPQLLLWNHEDKVHPQFDRVEIDARLKRVRSSITAIEVCGIMSIIDYFEKSNFTTNIGMVGLSYGGFYTLLTAALDTRITAAISCSFFNERSQYPRPDWMWNNAASLFGDAEMVCLIYPRYICIQVGTDDEYCDYNKAKTEERLRGLCTEVGNDWVDIMYFDGEHEFCKEDEPINKLIEKLNK